MRFYVASILVMPRERGVEEEEEEGERNGRLRSFRILPILLLFPVLHCWYAIPCLIGIEIVLIQFFT